jgi:hypothetical protein
MKNIRLLRLTVLTGILWATTCITGQLAGARPLLGLPVGTTSQNPTCNSNQTPVCCTSIVNGIGTVCVLNVVGCTFIQVAGCCDNNGQLLFINANACV